MNKEDKIIKLLNFVCKEISILWREIWSIVQFRKIMAIFRLLKARLNEKGKITSYE